MVGILTIHALVQQAIESGYLTLAVEAQLQRLSQHQRSRENIYALMKLQRGVMEGEVKQESHQSRYYQVANVGQDAESA